MFTIIQQGEQDSMFYTVQANGHDIEHFTTLESACNAIENLKSVVSEYSNNHSMVRWFNNKGDK